MAQNLTSHLMLPTQNTGIVAQSLSSKSAINPGFSPHILHYTGLALEEGKAGFPHIPAYGLSSPTWAFSGLGQEHYPNKHSLMPSVPNLQLHQYLHLLRGPEAEAPPAKVPGRPPNTPNPTFPPTPCACAHGTPSAAPPLTDLGVHGLAAQARPVPASVPGTALRQDEVGLSNPLRRFCTRQTRVKLVRSPPLVSIRRAARLTSEPRCAATAAPAPGTMAAFLAEPGSAFGLGEPGLQFPEASAAPAAIRRESSTSRRRAWGLRLDASGWVAAGGCDCMRPSFCGAPRRGAGPGGPGVHAGAVADLEKAGLGPPGRSPPGLPLLCQTLGAPSPFRSSSPKIVATSPLHSPGSCCQVLQESDLLICFCRS